MKKKRALVAFLIGLVMFFGANRPAGSAPPALPNRDDTEASMVQGEVGYLGEITFEKTGGKERVTLMVSKQPAISIENQVGNAILLKLENMFVPEELGRPLGEGKLTNIITVSPSQKVIERKQWVYLTIELKERVPYSVRQEGEKVLIDFNVASLVEAVTPTGEKPAYEAKTPSLTGEEVKPPKVATKEEGEKPKYTGHKISLDFQEANIKSVFRLLSELGGISIVSSDDVKGNITVHMENVPWDQALDTILTIQSLGKRQEGSVITVKTLEGMKKEEVDQRSLEEAQKKAEELAKEAEQKLLIEKGKLRQISIEAKIVEVNTEFSRGLGVQWGGGYRRGDYGVLVGTGGLYGAGTVTTLPGSGIGFTSSNIAVNFPSATLAAAPAVGVILGSSKFVLDAKLEALETTGEGKIVSSPKVTTLEGVEATIWQGKEVPVVTPGTVSEPPTVTYKDAKLELTVTPRITPDGEKISVEVGTINKDLDWANAVLGNPAINTSGVKSNIVVKDGDTFVVGGIYKEIESNLVSGIPGLSRIPVLGWLFKYETKAKTKREILVFVTTKIIKEL